MRRLVNMLLSAAMLAAWAGAVQAGILCGPYLQMPATDSMGVAWETENASGGSVEYGPTGGAAIGTVKAAEGGTMHHVTLTGLKPGGEYWYQVTSDGATSEKWTFRTAPTVDQDVETRVVFWSDVQHGAEWVAADGGFKEGAPANWTGAGAVTRGNLAEMMKFAPHLQFVLGDIADRGDREVEWRHVFNILRPLCATAPLIGVVGNHDSGGNLANWRKYFRLPENSPDAATRETAYSLAYGPLHFVALPYSPGWERYAGKGGWAAKDVAAARRRGARWVFAGAHSGWEGQALTGDVLDLGLDFFFSGHTHSYHRSFPAVNADRSRQGAKNSANPGCYDAGTKGTIFVVTGTMGSYGKAASRTRNVLNAQVFEGSTRTFSRMAIRGGKIAFGTFDHTGKQHDAFVFDRSDTTGRADPLPQIARVKVEAISGYAAKVAWETQVGAFSSVEYAPAAAPDRIRRTPVIQEVPAEGAQEHVVTLYALSPQTEYRCRVKNRRGPEWAVGEWQTFKTPAAAAGQLVCVLNFAPAEEHHVGGTLAASLAQYAEDLGYGWLPQKGAYMGESFGYDSGDERPKGLLGLDPTGPEGRYRMARSRIRIAHKDRVPFRLDLPDGKYELTFGMGTLLSTGHGKIWLGDETLVCKPWPEAGKHTRDWDFRAKHARTIRVAGDAWEGEDELVAACQVTGGRLCFDVGPGDSSLPDPTYWWRGNGICYLIVRAAK